MAPPLLLYHSLSITPAMHPPPPLGRASASLEQLPRCWRDPLLLPLRPGGGRDLSVAGHDLQFTHRSGWRRFSVVAQAQPSSQPIRSRKDSRGPGEEEAKVIFVANTSSTGAKSQTATVAASPPFPSPQPQIGSPLLWIGVGVGISIFFSWAARRVQSYAMQQAFKSMMQQTGQGSNPFVGGQGNNPFVGGQGNNPFGSSPFGGQGSNPFGGQGSNPFVGVAPGSFPSPPPPPPSSSVASRATVDVTASPVPSSRIETQATVEKPPEFKKPAFTDVNINLLMEEEPSTSKAPSEKSQEEPLEQASSEKVPLEQVSSEKVPFKEPEVVDVSSFRDQSSNGGQSSTTESGKAQNFISMEMLERMLDDPKIQKMVFPYLPEEMRDPATFKQMIQLPPVRQQLQEALNNMGGEDGLDMLKYMNSDVVKQQFEQVGLSPEEVVGKILANPEIAASLQNSKVVEAIMDCSQNPLNITKYQNDKEVMNALFKIAELFPGATSSPY